MQAMSVDIQAFFPAGMYNGFEIRFDNSYDTLCKYCQACFHRLQWKGLNLKLFILNFPTEEKLNMKLINIPVKGEQMTEKRF